jgi:hypothetical protein
MHVTVFLKNEEGVSVKLAWIVGRGSVTAMVAVAEHVESL